MRITTRAAAIFRQLFEKESSTYTYILGCEKSRQAAIIDPVLETAARDAKILRELGLQPLWALNTHVHADHITGTAQLKKEFPSLRSAISGVSGGRADELLLEGQIVRFGDVSLRVRGTPGHTDGCVTFVDDEGRRAFTGDALLIRGCGRTDFQQGDARRLYRSVWEGILSLPDDFSLWVGHNYEGITQTTVAEEKKWNPRLTKSEDEFVEFMNSLNLPYPRQIDRAVPANIVDGETTSSSSESKLKSH